MGLLNWTLCSLASLKLFKLWTEIKVVRAKVGLILYIPRLSNGSPQVLIATKKLEAALLSQQHGPDIRSSRASGAYLFCPNAWLRTAATHYLVSPLLVS